jgi:1-deoxy-D-xylulose-5-phosphate reductoisomerase
MKKRIAILGSTGSIGTQTLDVIGKNPDRFEVVALTANTNVRLLIEQARKFRPEVVAIGDDRNYLAMKEALKDLPVRVTSGPEAIGEVVQQENTDMVVAALVGYSGLIPTLRAIAAGKDIALANKETLVVAGELITGMAEEKKVKILPVDSEHSAVFQCLVGENHNPAEKILLTCSGGPFRGYTREKLLKVTSGDALAHPNWDMGAKITIDSATLMNKGFEMIEAHWLFGLSPEQIEVVVHPQSIIHSMVQFRDGSIKAQLGLPDMRLPILYALGYPERVPSDFPRFNFLNHPQLTFESPDIEIFSNLALAFDAINSGGNMPCILNAANEIVVSAFLAHQIGFMAMPEIIAEIMNRSQWIAHPSLDDLIATNSETRERTEELLRSRKINY